MSEFVLRTDTDNIFLIKFSEIDSRLDAPSFKNRFKFFSVKFNTVKLNQVAFIDPQTTFSKLKSEEEISFFPMEAISDIDGEIIKHQTKKVSESKGYTRFKEGDLIWSKITPCMQNGKSAVVNNTLNGYACGSTEYYVIRPKEDKVLVEYIHLLLRDRKILDSAQNFFGGSAGQQRVSKDFLLNFDIPIPPIKLQEEIVRKIQVAKSLKQQKEVQAKQLLDSIDEYLLHELGITLPEKDNSLQNRIFTTSLSKVSGGRFDPFFNQIHFEKLKNPRGIYTNQRVKSLCVEIKTGFPVRKDFRIKDGKYPYYGANGIIGYMDEYTHDGEYLVVGQDGYIGNHYVVDGKFWGSNHNWVLKLKRGTNIQYIKEVLDVINYDYLVTGGVIPKLTKEALQNIFIPVPPLEKQNEIAEQIKKIREQAKQLQKEAEEELENAKKEVEAIILGS